MSVRSAVRAVVVSVLALATVPALVPGVAHATTTAVNCPVDNLQTAITAASAGDTLDVTGTCTGGFFINKDITLQGDGATTIVGGGSIALAPTVHLNDLTLTGGSSNSGPGSFSMDGGAVVTLLRVTVTGNHSTNSGLPAVGAIQNVDGTLNLVDTTVSGNTATDAATSGAAGGGIDNFGTLSLTNSTVSGNSASAGAGALASGGGIFNDGTLSVVDSTVSGNTATGSGNGDGGGIFNNGGTASVTATIVSGNTVGGTTTGSPDCRGSFTSGGYNLIGDTAGCSGFVATDRVGTAVDPIDARLDSLQNNGGPTQTMGLLPGSPAIGAIPLSGGGACLVGQATDQRGVPRPQGKGCDIGAVEKGRTTTGVASSVNPSTLGQSVTFTATVCANPSSLPATPTGTVHFRDGGTGPFLGSPVALAPGGGTRCAQAQLTTSALPVGRGKILGIYSGDGVNNKSRGGVLHKVKA